MNIMSLAMPGMGGGEKKEKKKDTRADELAERNIQEGTAKASSADGYRKGGRVKKTGSAKLHKGEIVVRKPTRKTARGSGRR